MPNEPLMPTLDEMDAETQRFYVHLDRCSQCRNHPFNLCVLGGYLLRDAAAASGSGPLAALKVVTSAQQGAEADSNA